MSCRVALLQVRLSLPGVRSLKEKRRILASIKDRIRDRFNVSVAEVGLNDVHQAAEIAVASVGNDSARLNGRMDKIMEMLRSERGAFVVDHDFETF